MARSDDVPTDPEEWSRRTLVDRKGERIGEVDYVYVDDVSGLPKWAGVLNLRLIGMRPALVPLRRASLQGEAVRLRNVTKAQVRAAPYVPPDRGLSEEDEDLLLRHYRLPRGVKRRPAPPKPPRGPTLRGG
jgi:hypothetical protein